MEKLARAGYVACGFVYITVGILAARVAWGEFGAFADPPSALELIKFQPFGLWILPALSAGLAAYAAWRLVQAVADPDCQGTSFKGAIVRAGRISSGLAYSALALFAARLVIGTARANNSKPDWVVRVLYEPVGGALAVLVSLTLLGVAADDARKALTTRFGERLQKRKMNSAELFLTRCAGIWGFAARALILSFAAFHLALAAWSADPSHAKGFESVLATIVEMPHGDTLLRFVSVGLSAHGMFMMQAGIRRRHPF